jgi:hypothetical protein
MHPGVIAVMTTLRIAPVNPICRSQIAGEHLAVSAAGLRINEGEGRQSRSNLPGTQDEMTKKKGAKRAEEVIQ